MSDKLTDYTWQNCTHNQGRGHDYWLVCRECAVAYFTEIIEARAREITELRSELRNGGAGVSI